ncbi:DUF6850 family outer membrane beta-barrel protein [Chryseobacterium pennipullorum]|uniref:DUF6850 domain-containing protein n=1 Tax=Chryseobacterium pennipullorum TaxID=2258963 RepID=A0A3D9ARV8_9FLAO|nr:DUF6850 family outer membrane beta-barrel protein [Chryseobacterium pennipullorum]REC44074.1 hypothetical protein DRF67_18320 [Chryseobacterium pennipullorum]
MKYFLSIPILLISLFGTVVKAQANDTITAKIREEYSYERLFKNTVNANPSTRLGAGKYSLTAFSVWAETKDTPLQLKQKGNGQHLWGVEARTVQNLDDQTVVWGHAAYTQGKNKQVVWNENADYDRIYPYVAADSVGGDMRFENYSFSGGYSKQINTFTFGITGRYQASLSYRDTDPRPKNTAATFSVALGADQLMFKTLKIGAYLDAEKYTQKHYLSFVSNQGYPTIYTMSGLGNYNELLSGKLRQAYYEGWTYGGGIQIFEAERRNWYVTVGLKKINLDKLLTEYTDLHASTIDEHQVNISLGKFFGSGKLNWGLFADGSIIKRKGTENLFLNENSRNYIQIGSVEKYSHAVDHVIFKGLLQMNHKNAQSSWVPYFGWIREKEKYSSPLSLTDLHKIVYGADYQWLKTFNNSQTLSISMGLSATNVYRKNGTFNNSGKPAINQMLQENYAFQTSDVWQAKLDMQYHFNVPVIKNVFIGGKMMYSNFKNGSNTLFAATIGSLF